MPIRTVAILGRSLVIPTEGVAPPGRERME
jgi:hypothetical protein